MLEFVYTVLQEVENRSGSCHHPSCVAIEHKKWHHATSAREGWKLLCTANGLDTHSMEVTWIYQQCGALIHVELLGSRRLKENGLESIVAGMALLCYVGTHGQHAKLTATLYNSLTAGQRCFTIWYTKHGADRSQ